MYPYMPKHTRRRRSRNFAAKRVEGEIALGTLANATVAANSLEATTSSDFYLISMDLYGYIRNLTAGEGPIYVGICHGAYTVTQIKEWVEAGDAFGRDNPVVSVEQNGRFIRELGVFNGLAAEEVLFDGKPRRIKCGFVIPDSIAIEIWAYNRGSGTMTTGALVGLHGKAYINWV